jgi:hypothetical protein
MFNNIVNNSTKFIFDPTASPAVQTNSSIASIKLAASQKKISALVNKIASSSSKINSISNKINITSNKIINR